MHLFPTAIAALTGALVFERLHVPAGALLGAMAGVGVLNVLSGAPAPTLPTPLRFLSYASVGWLIGQGIDRETGAMLIRSALPVTLVVVTLVSLGLALGWLLVRMHVTDPATAYLATSPGGLSQMSAIGTSVGADAALVATVHTARVVTVIVLAPFFKQLGGAG